MNQKERSLGPSFSERLVQGSQAREAMIERNLAALFAPGTEPQNSNQISRQESAHVIQLWGRLPRPVKVAAFGITLLAAAACGTKGETEGVKIEPITPTQPVPTATKEAPTPTPEPTATPKPEPKSILKSEVVPTGIETVKSSIDLAYQRHPDVWDFKYKGGRLVVTREILDRGITQCQFGHPEDAGSPKLIVQGRLSGCSYIIIVFYDFYLQSGYVEFYDAGVKVYNYAITALGEGIRPQLDRLLVAEGVK